jgi:hypothetical protein
VETSPVITRHRASVKSWFTEHTPSSRWVVRTLAAIGTDPATAVLDRVLGRDGRQDLGQLADFAKPN